MKMDSVEANGTLLLHFKLCIDASIALLTFADNFVGRLFLPGLYRGCDALYNAMFILLFSSYYPTCSTAYLKAGEIEN